MNEIQNHLIFLLKEIDDICVKNDIPYLLGGRNAKDAHTVHKFLGEYMYASIMLRGQDFEKFRKLVSKMPNRAIESIMEYDDYSGGMAMRYVDESTTFLYGDSAHKYHHNGIYITIQKCRNIPKKALHAKIANGIEKVISYSNIDDISGLSAEKQKAVKMVRLANRIFGKRFVINRLLGLQNRLIKANSSTLAYVRPLKDNINIPASMFTKTIHVELCGHWFPVPEETDKYLKLVYGSKWKDDQKPEGASAPHLRVASTTVSYRDICTNNDLILGDDKLNAVVQKRKTLNAEIKNLRTKIEKNWDVLFLTQERYNFYRDFMPIIDIIQDKYDNGKFKWLNIVMKHYLDTVALYADKKWPVSVSPQLDDIVVDLLHRNKKAAAAIKFNKLRTSVALKPVSIKLSEQARINALEKLPPVISYDETKEIPVFLHLEDRYLKVARQSVNGEILPLLKKDGNTVKLIETTQDIIGDGSIIVVQNDNEEYEPIHTEKWTQVLFAENTVAELVQECYGKDIVIACCDITGRIYVTSKFDDAERYNYVQPKRYCKVTEDLEVPVFRCNPEGEGIYEVFCMGTDGIKYPVVKLGNGGSLKIAENAADMLYYSDEDGHAVRWDITQYSDAAYDDVNNILFTEAEPQICEKLVQKDAFDRIIEIAAIYDDGCIVPTGNINSSGEFSSVAPKRNTISQLYLKQNDGMMIPLATIDADGRITAISSAQDIVSTLCIKQGDGNTYPIASIDSNGQILSSFPNNRNACI